MPPTPAGSCRQIREGLTEYLEDALPPARRRGFDSHLSACPDCRRFAGQLQATIGLLATRPPDAVPPETRHALLRALRGRQSA